MEGLVRHTTPDTNVDADPENLEAIHRGVPAEGAPSNVADPLEGCVANNDNVFRPSNRSLTKPLSDGSERGAQIAEPRDSTPRSTVQQDTQKFARRAIATLTRSTDGNTMSKGKDRIEPSNPSNHLSNPGISDSNGATPVITGELGRRQTPTSPDKHLLLTSTETATPSKSRGIMRSSPGVAELLTPAKRRWASEPPSTSCNMQCAKSSARKKIQLMKAENRIEELQQELEFEATYGKTVEVVVRWYLLGWWVVRDGAPNWYFKRPRRASESI